MDPVIKRKIAEEISNHSQQQLKAISEFCTTIQAKRNLSIYSLGKAISQEFNLSETSGIKLANAWNRYWI